MGNRTSVLAIAWGLAAAGPGGLQAQIAWDQSRWEVRAEEWRTGTYLGREALFLRAGTAWLEGTELQDGVIEFDMAAPAVQGFHGVRFRAVDGLNHEHVYLRPHQSGNPDAVQYTPIFNGVSGWQLYADERYVLPVEIVPDRWVHVRLTVRGRRAELAVDGRTLVFPELVREPVSGRIGLNSSAAGAWFANVVVRPGDGASFTGGEGAPPVEAPPGTVSAWSVSDPVAEEDVDGVRELAPEFLESRTWNRLEADVGGIANLARLHGNRSEDGNTVLARVALHADRARTLPVRFGFSDRARLFLNGRQIYAGADGYASRDYRFLGTVGLYDQLFLPLEAGENEIVLAVSEDFGGWAVTMQVADDEGIRVMRPAAPQ